MSKVRREVVQAALNRSKTRWVIEWIPHNKLDIYLTKGGFAKIYTAIWIGGRYKVWNSKEQELERSGSDIKVILKRLENVENATRHWFEEAKTHLDISNKYAEIVRCFGLTQDPLNRDYMLQTTKASDIYSIAMLMWEISSGQPPFFNHEHDYNLAMNIINGIRPKVVSGTPPEYKNLMGMSNELFHPVITNNIEMKESDFTDAYSKLFTSKVHQFENFPEPRMQPKVRFHSKPHDFYIPDNIEDFVKSSNKKNNNTSKISNIFKGNLYQNNNSNKQLLIYDFNLSVSSKKLSKIFKTSSRNGIQNNYIKEEKMQRQITKHHIGINNDDDICNNPNFHSVKQNELEISDEFKTNVK
ncbi:kinase-like domain-containing protein [Rhizophagus clarus]|uniref:Kinase-like domain-containing protein n=1 Tax=Rhizophagus clarus TaxID=94130 RepID=A0A8H3L4Y9_9GLOM|nr:kinase-like domain-containing protein [Rhizophagus clarus]